MDGASQTPHGPATAGLVGVDVFRPCVIRAIRDKAEGFTLACVADIGPPEEGKGAKLANMKSGERVDLVDKNNLVGIPTRSQREAARLLNVSRDSVLQATKVLKEGTSEEKYAPWKPARRLVAGACVACASWTIHLALVPRSYIRARRRC